MWLCKGRLGELLDYIGITPLPVTVTTRIISFVESGLRNQSRLICHDCILGTGVDPNITQLVILTVDGRSPAPVDRQFILLFTGFYSVLYIYTSLLVQDFFHQL